MFGKHALVLHCQWHKRENVIAYLPKSQQGIFRKKLQKAYRQISYKQVKQELDSVRKELNLLNQSAVNSLDEGLEETLTLHRLGMFEFFGISLKTTNCLESLNSQLEQYTRRVSYWKTPVNDNTCVAKALLGIVPNLEKNQRLQASSPAAMGYGDG